MEIKKDSDSKYTLCISDEMIENTINIDVQTINETQIQEIKSSDVDKKNKLFWTKIPYSNLIAKLIMIT